MERPKITLIVAVARNGVIGMDGGMPWQMPSDLKNFRRLTMGKPVVMGRRTFQSLRRPLDGRDNLVVTRDHGFTAPGAEVFHALEPALERAMELARSRGVDEVVIIGGADIYRQSLARADRIHRTEIEATPEGDTVFPPLDASQWREIAREPMPKGPKDEYGAVLVTLDRV